MSVILYSTNCPRCNVLKKKLEEKKVEFDISNDVDLLMSKGFTSAPALQVGDDFLQFMDAIKWVNNYREEKI